MKDFSQVVLGQAWLLPYKVVDVGKSEATHTASESPNNVHVGDTTPDKTDPPLPNNKTGHKNVTHSA